MADHVPTPRKPNKRRARRQVAKKSTRALVFRNPLGVGRNIGRRVLDISETGIRLLIKEEMLVGHEFEINLEAPGSRLVKMLCKVVWSVRSEDGSFCIGAAFDKSIPYIDLIALTRP